MEVPIIAPVKAPRVVPISKNIAILILVILSLK